MNNNAIDTIIINPKNSTVHIKQKTTPPASPIPFISPQTQTSNNSPFRRVFQTSEEMRVEFVKFLKTIFYQLDDRKVLSVMEEILSDPSKSDEQVYKELLDRINETKKTFPMLSKLWSLGVLKKGMGKQASLLLKDYNPRAFHNYMEIYDRRYVKTLQKASKLALDGKVIAVSNRGTVGIVDRIEAGALASRYPYKTHVQLNDDNCQDPLLEPEKTHRPVNDKEVENSSLDFIACLGGFHHIPVNRVDLFAESLNRTLKPGGVILLREHNVDNGKGVAKLTKEEMWAIASVVHSFVNAADSVSWEIEKKEIREFESLEHWTQFMQKHGFTKISPKDLVLKDDPTENAMMAFVKNPNSYQELKEAIAYRNDCTRPKVGTRATWIEWGNVRFSEQYAEFIQDHHAYAFDNMGHLRQHWKFFYEYLKESMKDKEVSYKDIFFSDNLAMNLFILAATSIQCSMQHLGNQPSRLMARWKHGENWRNVCNLSDLEKFDAKNEKEYSSFINHTPFYCYDNVGKMKEMWNVVWNSPEPWNVKLVSACSAVTSSCSFLAKAAISGPIRMFYTSEANQEPDTIKMLVRDQSKELDTVIQRWESEKDQIHQKNHHIEVVFSTPDGYKLITVPRYKPFTKICGMLNEANNIEILEIGSQKEISVDVLLNKEARPPAVEGARVIYEMEKLQDPQERRYVTYMVNVCALKTLQTAVSIQNIVYIHE